MGKTGGPGTFIRRATAADQGAIRALIRAVGINPMGLHWQRFIVAEAGGRVVGSGQIKAHGDRRRELASIAVAPALQRRGIATAIIRSLQRRAGPPLYLTCASRNEGLYLRFGFRTLARDEMPPELRRTHRIVNLALRALHRGERLLVMRWDGG